MFADAAKARALANWTEAVTDSMLFEHLAGAARELAGWLGGVAYGALGDLPADDAKVEAAAEIEACLTIAFALPALNTFAAADGPVIPKQVEAAEFQYLEPEQATAQAATWRERAEMRWRGTTWSADADPAFRMYAV